MHEKVEREIKRNSNEMKSDNRKIINIVDQIKQPSQASGRTIHRECEFADCLLGFGSLSMYIICWHSAWRRGHALGGSFGIVTVVIGCRGGTLFGHLILQCFP